jgi:tagatose 1,6-diphosphate aldolase
VLARPASRTGAEKRFELLEKLTMPYMLTPGRWRGLQTTSTERDVFAIMAFDQRGNYRELLADGSTHDDAVEIKYEVVAALSPYTSAVLLDPIYGLKAALLGVRNRGLLMCVEKTGYSGDATYRRTDFMPGWTVSKIRRMGASAAKLLVYYHPDSGKLSEEIETLICQVAGDCHRHDLPLFVEPLMYSLDGSIPTRSAEFARTRTAVLCETARRLSGLGPDVLKLEFPVDVVYDNDVGVWQRACEAISAACAVPWVLLSAGVEFDIFERQVRTACQGGASGFLGGRAIWKECIGMNRADRQTFLKTTGVERLNRLSAIADELARPWTDFYKPQPVGEDWFTTYFPDKE